MGNEDEMLVTGKDVEDALGIPYTTLWRLAKAGVVPAHPTHRKPWHTRPVLRFKVSEVRAALDAMRGEAGGR